MVEAWEKTLLWDGNREACCKGKRLMETEGNCLIRSRGIKPHR